MHEPEGSIPTPAPPSLAAVQVSPRFGSWHPSLHRDFFFLLFIFKHFSFLPFSLSASLSFWKASYYAGSLPRSRLPPTSSPSAIVSNQF